MCSLKKKKKVEHEKFHYNMAKLRNACIRRQCNFARKYESMQSDYNKKEKKMVQCKITSKLRTESKRNVKETNNWTQLEEKGQETKTESQKTSKRQIKSELN